MSQATKHKLGLAVVLLAASLQLAACSGVFEITFNALHDSLGRDLRADCCSWQQQQAALNYSSAYNQHAHQYQYQHLSHLSHHHQQAQQHHLQQPQPQPQQPQQAQCDPKKCQLILRICVNYQSHFDPSLCTFGELSAQVMKPDEPSQSFGGAPSRHQLSNQIDARRYYPQPAPQAPQYQTLNAHQQRLLGGGGARATPAPSLPPSSGSPRAMRTIAFNQPISFPFNFTWPGSFSLTIDAWFESPIGLQQVPLPATAARHRALTSRLTSRATMAALAAAEQQQQQQLAAGLASLSLADSPLTTTYDLYKKQLIMRHTRSGRLAVREDWESHVHRTDTVALAYSYRVTCQSNYYGEKCNTLCRPHDDIYGHYTCSAQGEIQCLPGWQGEFCSDAICARGCPSNSCSRPGECDCRLGWQGPSCMQCVRHPSCVHGRCNKPYDCICDEGWGGLYCNVDLNFCTNHQPCKNGALCKNTFDSNGSYMCTCAPGFTGKNCTLTAAGQQEQAREQPATSQQQQQVDARSGQQQAQQPTTSQQPQQQQQQQQQQHPQAANQAANQAATRARQAAGKQAKASQLGPPIGPFLAAQFSAQPVLGQHQQPLDHWVMAAYGIIIVCMVILVLLLLFRLFLERSQARNWPPASDSSHVEEVARLQNNQNIYKSRASLTEKLMPPAFDTIDAGNTSSSDDSSAGDQTPHYHRHHLHYAHEQRQTRRQLPGLPQTHSYHNIHSLAAVASRPNIPPPPYTFGSQSVHYGTTTGGRPANAAPNVGPSSADNGNHQQGNSNHQQGHNATVNASTSTIYHPLSTGAPTQGIAAIYGNSAALNFPYATAVPNPYETGQAGSTTYQSPCYVIAYHLPIQPTG